MKDVSTTSVDTTLWEITEKLFKRYTLKEADRILSPLKWYIGTDRASLEFLSILVNTSARQKSTIAKRLEKGGTCEEAIDSVCEYLRYKRE